MLPNQVVTYAQLLKERFKSENIYNMSAALKLFPTPFKGVYYIPSKEERKGWFIGRPSRVLTKALAIFLKSDQFYYSCNTADEFWGISWHPSGEMHVVNEKRSGRINLMERIKRNEMKKTYRAGKIAAILSFYGHEIIFHRVKSIKDAKFKETPYGRFALRSQIKKDRKHFREKEF